MGTHHRTAIASGLLFTVVGAIGLGACISDTAEMPPIPDGSTPTSTTPPPPLPELDAAADATDAADAAIPPLPPPPPPKQDEVTEQFGIFVAANGAPGAAGTRAAPVSTISEGITLAKAAKKRVYVCAGTYTEALELLPGVSIVGNMDCATDPAKWTISQANALVASPTSPAITARDINVPTRIDGLDVIAPAGNDTEPSSIGLLAVNSTGLTFVGGKIEAQRGANGKNGELPSPFAQRIDQAAGDTSPISDCIFLVGGSPRDCTTRVDNIAQNVTAYPATSVALGGQVSCTVDGNARLTGNGGKGGTGIVFSTSTTPYTLVYVAGNGGQGTPATTPPSPAAGTSSTGGSFTADGYAVAQGTKGGEALQMSAGGSGGRGSSYTEGRTKVSYSYSGGGGGAGGCPGRSGEPGQDGGASVGVLATRSPVRFEKMAIRSAGGGNGGQGNFGAPPTAGQPGGAGPVFGTAGAAGAPGVQAGVSGHGAGGPSIAIVHDTTVPIQVQCQLAHGAAGVSPGEQTQPGTFPGQPARTIPAAAPALAQDTFKY